MDEFGMKPFSVVRRQVVLEDIERGARELACRKRGSHGPRYPCFPDG
jgi:hypothetical protein